MIALNLLHLLMVDLTVDMFILGQATISVQQIFHILHWNMSNGWVLCHLTHLYPNETKNHDDLKTVNT